MGLLDYMATLFLVFWGTSILFSIVAAPVYIPTNRNCSLYCAHQSRARAPKVQLFQHNLCPWPHPHQPHTTQPSSQATWAPRGHGCHCSVEYPRRSVLDNNHLLSTSSGPDFCAWCFMSLSHLILKTVLEHKHWSPILQVGNPGSADKVNCPGSQG